MARRCEKGLTNHKPSAAPAGKRFRSKFTKAQQDVICLFLGENMLLAQAEVRKWRAVAPRDDTGVANGNVVWWADVCKAIRWLMSNVNKSQRLPVNPADVRAEQRRRR